MTAVLLNQSSRVISFLGGPTSKSGLGFRLVPTEHTALNADQVAAVKGDKTQSKIMRGFITATEIVDVNGTFSDLPAVALPPPPKMPEPKTTRFDSTTSTAAVRAAEVEAPIAEEDHTSVSVPLTPPAPAFVASAPKTIADLDTPAALALIASQTKIEELGAMWSVENASASRRADVVAAIEARGHAINAQSATQPK